MLYVPWAHWQNTFTAKQSGCIWSIIDISAECHHKANSWLIWIVSRNQTLNTRDYYACNYYDIFQLKERKAQ